MYLRQFPDLSWIRKAARESFAEGRDISGRAIPAGGWPSVILHTRSGHTERDAIKGTFSLFLNLNGETCVRAGGRMHRVGTDHFFLSNRGEFYDLHIPENAEIFNLHFGEALYRDVLTDLIHSSQDLLDNPETATPAFEIMPRLYGRNASLNRQIAGLRDFCNSPEDDAEREMELLADILRPVLRECSRQWRGRERIGSLKASTRRELFRRVCLARDLLHDHLSEPFSLESLGRATGMSRFHLLRTFQAVFGCSPREYQARLRLSKARNLLAGSDLPMQEIADGLGFTEPAAFSRFVKKRTGMSPLDWRKNLQSGLSIPDPISV